VRRGEPASPRALYPALQQAVKIDVQLGMHADVQLGLCVKLRIIVPVNETMEYSYFA